MIYHHLFIHAFHSAWFFRLCFNRCHGTLIQLYTYIHTVHIYVHINDTTKTSQFGQLTLHSN